MFIRRLYVTVVRLMIYPKFSNTIRVSVTNHWQCSIDGTKGWTTTRISLDADSETTVEFSRHGQGKHLGIPIVVRYYRCFEPLILMDINAYRCAGQWKRSERERERERGRKRTIDRERKRERDGHSWLSLLVVIERTQLCALRARKTLMTYSR